MGVGRTTVLSVLKFRMEEMRAEIVPQYSGD